MTITITNIEKNFGRFPALRDVSLDIRDGELLALLGPSGSGKTTLLRTIAGLEFPERGQVLFDQADVTFASAADRRVGFVFQQYALFRHMTVARNIAFGLDVRKGATKPSKSAIAAKVEELLKLVELPGLGERYPAQLSGGQRQRVALARALAVDPSVLLLDEPFGALDATVRKSLRRELRRIHDATGVTTIFVTHDQEEALDLADRVAILNHGKIEQVGTPEDVYDRPSSPFVFGFVGDANQIAGKVQSGNFEAGNLRFASRDLPDGPAMAFVRPHDIALNEGDIDATVNRLNVQGPLAQIEAVTDGGLALELVAGRHEIGSLAVGSRTRLRFRQEAVFSTS